MTLKTCYSCKESKEESLFYKKSNNCRQCINDRRKCKEHGKNKNTCKECCGSFICIHNKRKNTCKDCGESYLCPHKNFKSRCKDCGGASICIHNKRKDNCVDCGGKSTCEHNKRKDICVDCGGPRICEHKKIKAQCRECKGTSICIHDKRKTTCKECGGKSICEHNKHKADCKDCKGRNICPHGKFKYHCIVCTPSRACIECKSIFVSKITNCYPLCQACFCNKYPDNEKSTLYKIKERYLRDELRTRFPDKSVDMIFDKKVEGGCSRRKPDVLIDLLLYSIIIECDENQHISYECENKRTMQLFEDLGSRPLIIIRFNPDSYIDISGFKVEGCFKPVTKIEEIHKKKFYDINENEWKRRLDVLEGVINGKITPYIPTKELDEVKVFYDEI